MAKVKEETGAPIIMSEDEKALFDDYLTKKKEEKEKAEKAKTVNENADKIQDHINKRVREVETEEGKDKPSKLFYQYSVTAGGGLRIWLGGVLTFDFIVKEETPVYKSVDNVVRRVIFKDPGQFFSLSQHYPYSLICTDSEDGDRLRSKIFEAYENALKIFQYCRDNETTVFKIAGIINPEFKTLFDYEVKKFFDGLTK